MMLKRTVKQDDLSYGSVDYASGSVEILARTGDVQLSVLDQDKDRATLPLYLDEALRLAEKILEALAISAEDLMEKISLDDDLDLMSMVSGDARLILSLRNNPPQIFRLFLRAERETILYLCRDNAARLAHALLACTARVKELSREEPL
jgi:hypothetical protein